jgi:hypothetical protein
MTKKHTKKNPGGQPKVEIEIVNITPTGSGNQATVGYVLKKSDINEVTLGLNNKVNIPRKLGNNPVGQVEVVFRIAVKGWKFSNVATHAFKGKVKGGKYSANDDVGSFPGGERKYTDLFSKNFSCLFNNDQLNTWKHSYHVVGPAPARSVYAVDPEIENQDIPTLSARRASGSRSNPSRTGGAKRRRASR